MGFSQKKLLVDLNLETGNEIDLQEYLYFKSATFGNLRTRTKKSDGISTPKLFQLALEKFGKYVASGILHDGGFKGDIEQEQPDGSWRWLLLNEHECNQLIDEALASQGCPYFERKAIYEALELFGYVAWREDAPYRVKSPAEEQA